MAHDDAAGTKPSDLLHLRERCRNPHINRDYNAERFNAMTHTARLARQDAFTDALRAADRVIGNEHATPQALQIIEAIKRLRDEKPARVASLNPVDYLTKVQEAARANWQKAHGPYNAIGPGRDAVASVETPLGLLSTTTWRTRWNGERIAWASEYSLAGEPITVAEIKAAGLAQRPTTRNRRRK